MRGKISTLDEFGGMKLAGADLITFNDFAYDNSFAMLDHWLLQFLNILCHFYLINKFYKNSIFFIYVENNAKLNSKNFMT